MVQVKQLNRNNFVDVFRKTDWTWVQIPSSPQLYLFKGKKHYKSKQA